MSSPDSDRTSSSVDDDAATPSRRRSGSHDENYNQRRPSFNAVNQRPLPNPLVRSHSGQMLAAVLRDRPLPLPTNEQTAEERRRSIIAMDRKRRLTSTYEDGRRRTNSGSFYDRRTTHEGYRQDGPSSPVRNHTMASRSAPNVVDLTGSSPPAAPPHPPPRENRMSRSSSDNSRRYVVPQWQPDSEVSECPICKRPFTWMFRRHHCRKCGRVVCNDCSPHRITIPRQFIVHPPGPNVAPSSGQGVRSRYDPIDLTADDNDEERSGGLSSPYRFPPLEGGEKVRLCNPCVPDPQPDPFSNYPPTENELTRREFPWSHAIGHARASSHEGVGTRPVIPAKDDSLHNPLGYDGSGGLQNRMHYMSSQHGQTSQSRYRSVLSSSAGGDRSFAVPSREFLPPERRSSYGMSRPSYPASRQPRDELATPASRTISGSHVPTRAPYETAATRFPVSLQNVLNGPSRPRLEERDICPICRRALPPRGPNGDETMREAHIMDCIRARDPSYQVEGAGGPSQARVHMLPFVANEKDCVGEDGSPQECSICMVEYDVGDELARLECLCKFHKTCIVEWLERKAECPVHKLMA